MSEQPRAPEPLVDDLRRMLEDVQADYEAKRDELENLEDSMRWLRAQIGSNGSKPMTVTRLPDHPGPAKRIRVSPEAIRGWAQTRQERFTPTEAAKHFGCSVGQMYRKLDQLAEAGTLTLTQVDVGAPNLQRYYEFEKPEVPVGPRRRPRGHEVVTYGRSMSAPVAGTGGGSTRGRYSTNKSANEEIVAALGRGWEIEDRGDSLLLVGPQGQRVTTHKTPGEGRAVANLKGLIRRAERNIGGRWVKQGGRQPAFA